MTKTRQNRSQRVSVTNSVKLGEKRKNVHFVRRVLNVTHCTKTRQKDARRVTIVAVPNVFLLIVRVLFHAMAPGKSAKRQNEHRCLSLICLKTVAYSFCTILACCSCCQNSWRDQPHLTASFNPRNPALLFQNKQVLQTSQLQ